MTDSRLSRSFRELLCSVLAVSAATLGPIASVRAELIPTDAAVRDEQAQDSRSELLAWLERDDMQAQLKALGVDADEARARVRSLSDAEVLAVHGRLSELPAGQGFVEAVVGVALVTAAVILFTDLLGYTDVYPFIRPLPRASDTRSNEAN